MAHNDSYAQIVLSVKDIQNYLFAAGRINEIIGGLQLIAACFDKAISFCKTDLHLKEVDKPSDAADWYINLQQSADSLRLLVANRDLAKQILSHVSLFAIEECSGIPLFGTIVDLDWTSEDLKAAPLKAQQAIWNVQSTQLLPIHTVWPFASISPIDGLPTVDKDHGKNISIESKTRIAASKLDANDVFQNILTAVKKSDTDKILNKDANLLFPDEINDLVRHTKIKRVALVEFDVNNFNALLTKAQNAGKNDPAAHNKLIKSFTELVDSASEQALVAALLAIIRRDRNHHAANYILPARLLINNNGQTLIVVRADLVFEFVDTYAATFEAYTNKQNSPLSVGCGMVVMSPSYSFSRAFTLVENLTASAKAMTMNAKEPRPSSIDYLVVTNDIETDIDVMRNKDLVSNDGCSLTCKPFILGKPYKIDVSGKKYVPDYSLSYVVHDARLLHELISSTQLRPAIDLCKQGRAQGQRAWRKLRDNLKRGLGSSKNALDSFERIFPDGFFFEKGKNVVTLLGDYLEIRHLFDSQEEN